MADNIENSVALIESILRGYPDSIAKAHGLKAAHDVRAAIASQGEPYAYEMWDGDDEKGRDNSFVVIGSKDPATGERDVKGHVWKSMPLYTAPPAAVPAPDVAKIAESLASMVIAWVGEDKGDWRTGLPHVIKRRLSRFIGQPAAAPASDDHVLSREELAAYRQRVFDEGVSVGKAAGPAGESDAAPKLPDAEIRFLGLVWSMPDSKLNDYNIQDEWEKPEELGLVECTGSYKWRARAKTFGEFVLAVAPYVMTKQDHFRRAQAGDSESALAYLKYLEMTHFMRVEPSDDPEGS